MSHNPSPLLHRPDYHTHDEFKIRERKLKELQEKNIDPYPVSFKKNTELQKLHQEWEGKSPGSSEDAEAGTTPICQIAGRIMLFRSMGKNAFAQVQDDNFRIQVMFNRDLTLVTGLSSTGTDETPWKWLEKRLDLGDIIGIEGHLFRTHKGELTVFVKNVTVLCKTLLPLADKHSGLIDKESRFRKRWLDLIMNEESQPLFAMRSRILKLTRDFMHERGYIEVETPVLQSIYGGAEAKPFETHLHALEQDMFLRISLEIPLKKLIVGGVPKVFEIGRVFRNEGIDRNHNPEFTLMEAYSSYEDYNDLMVLVETLFESLALKLHGKTEIPAKNAGGEEVLINLKAPWTRLSMKDAIKKYASIDVDTLSTAEMEEKLLTSGHVAKEKLKTMNRGLMIAALFEVYAEPFLIQPHHIIDHPIETTPLCKPHRDPQKRKEGLVERFESFVLASEVSNAYSELNDPVLQRELLENQALRREKGDEEASPLDEEFIEAICQGMPPTAGVGIGMDRLIMLLTNSHSIRDILLFPWMKPETKDS